MTLRKRPSGNGSNSRRFSKVTTPNGEELKVPAVKDVGTFLYLSDDDGATWSRPVLILDGAYELREGALIEVEELAPGNGMGVVTGARITMVKVRVGVDTSGRYSRFGQLKRLVYAVRVPNIDELGDVAL